MAAPSAYFVDPVNGSDSTGNGLTIGTAWKTPQKALDTITQDTTDGDIIHLKTGGLNTLSAALSLSSYGTPSEGAPLIFRGFTTTVGDGGIGDLNGGGSVSVFSPAKSGVIFIDMHCHDCGSANILVLGQDCRLINVEVADSTGTGLVVSSGAFVQNCYFHDIGSVSTTGLTPTDGSFFHCVFHNDGQAPSFMILPGTPLHLHECIFILSGATEGIRGVDGTILTNCSFYGGGGTGKGIHNSAARDGQIVSGCIFEGFSGTGAIAVSFHTGSHVSMYNQNAFYDNTTDAVNAFADVFGSDNESLSSSPFTSAASNDFSTPDSNGKVRATDGGAYPPQFRGSTSTTIDLNKGASQDSGQAVASGGGGRITTACVPTQ